MSSEAFTIERSVTDASAPLLWIGAASFEERSLGCARSLTRLTAALMIRYETTLRRSEGGYERQVRYTRELRGELGRCRPALIQEDPVGAYDRGGLRKRFDRFIAKASACILGDHYHVILDVTCLTKIHAIYLLVWLLRDKRFGSVEIAYTSPRDYGSPGQFGKRATFGWVRIVQPPLATAPEEAGLPRRSYGLFLGSHEGDRARAARANRAFDVIDYVQALTPGSPILEDRTRAQNEDLIREIRRHSGFDWRVIECDKYAARSLETTLIERMKSLQAVGALHVYFGPFGPKPHLVASVLALLRTPDISANVLYAVPAGYDPDYTRGAGETRWYLPDRSTLSDSAAGVDGLQVESELTIA